MPHASHFSLPTPVFLIGAAGKVSDLRVPCFSRCRLRRLSGEGSDLKPVVPTETAMARLLTACLEAGSRATVRSLGLADHLPHAAFKRDRAIANGPAEVRAQSAGNLLCPAMHQIFIHYIVPHALPRWKQDRKL